MATTTQPSDAPAVASTPADRDDPGGILGIPTGVTLVLTLAAATIAMGGLRYVASIIGPVFFALTLAIAVRPAMHWLIRKGLPAWASTLLVLLGLYTLLFGMLGALAAAIAQLSTKLPDYSDRFEEIYNQILSFIGRFGIETADIKEQLQSFDYTSILGVAQKLLASITAGSTQVLTLVMVLAFLVFDTANLTDRATELTRARPALAAALTDFSSRVRKYWVVSTVFGLVVAIMDYFALLSLGVPLAFTWGVFAFITNYIPNVGFVIGLVPPALLALLEHGPVSMIWVIAAYTIINFVMQSVIQPKFTGDAVGLNTSVTFISLIFWTAIIGPLGAVLAVPLTLFFKSVLIDSDRRLRWLNVFLKAASAKEQAPHPDGRDIAAEREVTDELAAAETEESPQARAEAVASTPEPERLGDDRA
ncbi:MAG: AI-2E family transporter [Micrococcales bacterium]|nr:AI-2E family transporter [Micrococcales bacterium]